MAFKENISWGNLTSYEQGFVENGTFNIDMAVGWPEHGTGYPAANRVTDMQLVFYFLWKIYRDGDNTIFPKKPGENYDLTPRDRDFNSDSMKNKISNILYRFQTDLLKAGRLVYRDGRCDKANGETSSISKTKYTIHHLNFNYGKTIKLKHNRDDWQEFLLTDPYLPEQTRNEIILRSFPYTYM